MLSSICCLSWVYSVLRYLNHWIVFVKQKTAYEMRISDWSSDVCSSDLSRALGGGDPATKLYELAVGLGAEMSLAKLGMPKDGIAKAAALAVANPYPNPRPITEEGIVQLLSRAVEGLPPITA